jgi:hypothetical protein
MSTFLGFEDFIIPLGDSVQDVQNTFETALNSYGWQTQRRALVPTAYPTTNMVNYQNAFNMVGGDYAGSNGVGSGILGVQLPISFTPTSMYIMCGTGTQAPNTFILEYSSDGTTWAPLQTWTNETNWFVAEQRKYTVAGAGGSNYWRLRVSSANSTTLMIGEWALEDSSGNRVTANRFFDIIPPTTETIGNSDAMEVLRWTFGTNFINFRSIQYSKIYMSQVVAVREGNAGAVVPGITLNGATVTGAAGISTTSAKDNLRSLYEAIRVSTDPSYTDWYWEYQKPSPQNADDGADYIYGTKKTPGTWVNITSNGNVNTTVISGPVAPMVQGVTLWDTTNTTLTTDLVDGFIYYLQVCARGIALATKTNAAFYGPIHACYADNAKALTAMPIQSFPLKPTPIELLIGWDDIPANAGASARSSHVWGISNQTVRGISNIDSNYFYDGSWGTPFGHGRIRNKILDYFIHTSYYQNIPVSLYGSGMFSGGSAVGNDYQIHRINCIGETIGGNDSSIVPVIPALDIRDWYKFVGVANDESLMLVGDTTMSSTLTGVVAPTDTIISVVSTAGFQLAGYLVLENEMIQYTGISGNSFTGCTRGKYTTTATSHFSGDQVSQGLWFTKINGGAILCGYIKPTA